MDQKPLKIIEIILAIAIIAFGAWWLMKKPAENISGWQTVQPLGLGFAIQVPSNWKVHEPQFKNDAYAFVSPQNQQYNLNVTCKDSSEGIKCIPHYPRYDVVIWDE